MFIGKSYDGNTYEYRK